MRTLLALVVLASGTLAAQTRLQAGGTTVCISSRLDREAASEKNWWRGIYQPEDESYPLYWPAFVTCFSAPRVADAPSPVAPASPAAPSPAHSQTIEYRWPDSGTHTNSTLNIILKDGTVKQALAVCVQDGKLTYVTLQGTDDVVALDSVDFTATRRANAPVNSN